MTRAHLQTVSVATLLLLAACPPATEGTTDSTASSDTEATGTTGTSAEETDSTPTNSTPATMGETEPTGGTMSGTDSQSGTDTTTMTDPTTGTVEPECTNKDQCMDPAAPFCEAEKCVSCSDTPMPDTSCAGLSADAPVCSEGKCVECTADNATACQGNTPVCDANACTACTLHAQCGETACNLETGACFAPEYTLYVDRAAVCDGALGTMEAPFCKINDALAYVGVQPDLTVGFTVKIKGGNYVEDPLVVPDGATMVLTRWGDASPKIRAAADTGATLTVANGSKVFVDRLQLSNNDSKQGIVCATATVWVDDTRLAANQGQGFESTECTSYINRSVIYQNVNGGVASYDGVTHIRNSFITANGSADLSDFGGVLSAQNNELHIVYSTVAINLAPVGGRTLQCVGDGAVEVRNSVLIGYGMPSIDCLNGTFTSSAIDEGAVDGDGNYAATQADIMTFFDPPAGGVLAAKAGTPLENLAVWKDGDPQTDFNGTPRPNMDGEMDFAGADKP